MAIFSSSDNVPVGGQHEQADSHPVFSRLSGSENGLKLPHKGRAARRLGPLWIVSRARGALERVPTGDLSCSKTRCFH
ncbi:MAG: hypothetical protein CMJ75_19465 [Planctomycetaceae bacterium]|nr:hypothetical protein [Planctomycetaceae bacterium]